MSAAEKPENFLSLKDLKFVTSFVLFIFILGILAGCGGSPEEEISAETLLSEIGVTRGICVLLGDSNCELALQMAKKSELTIYVQLTDSDDVESARKAADEAGLYCKRIFIEKGKLSHIHLADNIADALVALGNADSISESEALRILRPEGKALIGNRKLVKPFPEGVDDWSHPYHGPDNNPQSSDEIAIAPYLTQFLAEPRYAPLPQVAVASAGKVFKAYGHIAFKVREEHLLNKLVAYNGYNGTTLWMRDLVPGIMVHRNTLIATPDKLYLGDDKSCKVIDTEDGSLINEIIPPENIAGGTFWKWMALEDGVLYALIGEQEEKDPVVRLRWTNHGWPWDPLSKGYNIPENQWGFGKNVLAINPETGEVLWDTLLNEPVDSRAVCMKNGRIFIFGFGSYLACLDAKNGENLWIKTPEKDPDLFEAIGKNVNRQDWQTNWRTTAYLKCSDKALYFAGPQVGKLLAVSTEDGSIMWENPYSNYQLVLRDDALYGISGPWGDNESKKFDPLTGEILGEYTIGRRACTRPTGAADAIFFRAMGGTVRFDLASSRQHWIPLMRPQCHDGVTIANGLLYWWPSGCDCQLSLYGITSLGPSGSFDFNAQASESERLEMGAGDISGIAEFPESPADWRTFRGNNVCSAKTEAAVPETCTQLWEYSSGTNMTPTSPTASGGLVFLSGSDGIIRALDSETGVEKWKVYTGGGIRIPPTVWKGRVFAGSGDGWVYSLEAKTGRLLWRFRAAPEERKIPVYGDLLSTWPAASGVLVEDGTAYFAAGITSYDGTHVYALDAESGKIKWHNNSSGYLDPEAKCGVSVQGHLLLNDEKLYLAGGTAVSPAVYDINDGRCLNRADSLMLCESINLRGWELFLIGDRVLACGQPFYKHPDHLVYDVTSINKMFHTSSGERDVIWWNNETLMCYPPVDRRLLNASVAERTYPARHIIPIWGKLDAVSSPFWEYKCEDSRAIAVCGNAVVVAKDSEIIALSLEDGKVLWQKPLPSPPVQWGIAVDSGGRIIVTLEDGRVLCFG